MMIYTVQVTVAVAANNQHEAYDLIRHALDHAKKAEITHIDSEVVDERVEEDDESEPTPPRKLTRQERLQGLADSGVDTWEEYRGER